MLQMHQYFEIPDNHPLKQYFPLNRTFWIMFQKVSSDYILQDIRTECTPQ